MLISHVKSLQQSSVNASTRGMLYFNIREKPGFMMTPTIDDDEAPEHIDFISKICPRRTRVAVMVKL